MPQRYFLEVMYKGMNYSGFQVQENAPNTIQQETEKGLAILAKKHVTMTGSSRTDTGVHALQNFFHFDFDGDIDEHFLYKINSIIPRDIVVKNIYLLPASAHCRFDAISRSYSYHIYQEKNPFLADKAYYFPYSVSIERLQQAAEVIKMYSDFTTFSKRNTQVKSFVCSIKESEWKQQGDEIIYTVKANRFLRGMVRGLTGTMLHAGRNKITIDQFKAIIEAKDCKLADFSVPGHGLFLTNIEYPIGFLPAPLAMR